MARVIRSPAAKRDIVDVIKYTKERWGVTQAREYASLIEEALVAIAHDPHRGKSREDIRAGILAHHISQRGRPARHILFYRINAKGTVEIVRFLHDAMDFEQHIR
jgi:toxin ParE1/3/4